MIKIPPTNLEFEDLKKDLVKFYINTKKKNCDVLPP